MPTEQGASSALASWHLSSNDISARNFSDATTPARPKFVGMPSVHVQLQTDASRCVRALPTNARTFGYKLRRLLLKGSQYAMHRLPQHSVQTTTEKSASNPEKNALFTRPATICTCYTQADLTIFPRKPTQHLPTRCCERRLTLHHTRQRRGRKEAEKCKITSTTRKTFERASRCSAWLPTHAWVKRTQDKMD
jgi:hypothetical protein